MHRILVWGAGFLESIHYTYQKMTIIVGGADSFSLNCQSIDISRERFLLKTYSLPKTIILCSVRDALHQVEEVSFQD